MTEIEELQATIMAKFEHIDLKLMEMEEMLKVMCSKEPTLHDIAVLSHYAKDISQNVSEAKVEIGTFASHTLQ